MRISPAPSIFESINARVLNPSQVAKTFVTSNSYTNLIKRNHTIIVGPRGSGKTTLLKMLQQPALEAWDHPYAETCRSHIDYSGVFIGTDLTWGAQIEALGDGELDTKSHKLLSKAAFTTHVLRALIFSMLNRITKEPAAVSSFRRVSLTDAQEVDLVKLICSDWHIKPAIPSLLSLKQALASRLSRIKEIASREITLGEKGRTKRLGNEPFLHLDFIESANIAATAFNDFVGEDGKWALLFDELELAPEWIQDELIRSLRSRHPTFLYKLAMSPFSHSARFLEIKSGQAPAADQDFEQIALWYHQKKQSIRFCRNLWDFMLRERGITQKDPLEILGPSYFETYPDEWNETGSAYTPNSKISQRFIALSQSDRTFRDYLSHQSINPKSLDRLPKERRDSVVRKIAPIVAIREYYRSPDLDRIRKISTRTRKSASLYAGAESLFAVSEGNPRWFIAIVGRLLDNWQETSRSISRGSQATEMLNAAQKFSAMLRTIPAPQNSSSTHDQGLLSVIEKIGNYFHNVTVVDDFSPEPPATFTVDRDTGDHIIAVLAQALNAGAIVYIPEDNSRLLLTSLKEKRFRISYLLAPHFGLPLRLGVDKSLSNILKGQSKSPNVIQEPLFNELKH